MIAEIYGKISSSGSNLNERLEDNLTGNVFGVLRYIPFDEAMKPLLANSIYPKSIANTINKIQARYWDNNAKFWPYDIDGEIDALFEFEDVIIGIEVKYLSGLSSDDGVDYSEQEESGQVASAHQLSRESRIVDSRGGSKKKVLIFISNSSSCRYVYEDTIRRGLINKNVELGYISWQDFLFELTCLKLNNEFYSLIISDLVKLLKKKGFEQFMNMSIENEIIIDPSYYFMFDYEPNNLFDFNINIYIEGDLYYEFR